MRLTLNMYAGDVIGAQHCLHTASCIHAVVIIAQELTTLLTN